MNRRTYIYWAVPLFIILSCGEMLEFYLGGTGALVVAGVVAVVAWGVVWLRLYKAERLRPEFAVLSILPQTIYYIERYAASQLFSQSPVWQNLYALTWVGFVVVIISTVRRGVGDEEPTSARDPLFLLMAPLTFLYAGATFLQFYSKLITP